MRSVFRRSMALADKHESQHDNPENVDENCAKPPNCLVLDKVFENQRQSSGSKRGGCGGEQPIIINNHIDRRDTLGDVDLNNTSRKRKDSPDSDSENSDTVNSMDR